MGKQQYEEDDGRTVADMSVLEKRSILTDWIGVRGAGSIAKRRSDVPCSANVGEIDHSERRAAIRGALGASLLIGCIYLAVFAVIILVLLFLWGVL